jgi:NADH dehydrogenase
MILVAGGTGRLGTLVVGGLAGRGLPVRVLTRDPARAAHLAGARVEAVTGDVRDRAAVRNATSGVTLVVSAVQGFAGPGRVSPRSVDRAGNINLTDAAAAAGAGFVLLSVIGAAPDSPLELFRMKHAAESYLRSSGIPATVIRAAAFLETWAGLLEQTARRSGRPLVFGQGGNPVTFVSAADVAWLVEEVVMDPASRGQTLEIGGPDTLTMSDFAVRLQAAAGRAGTPRHVPRAALQLAAATLGRVSPATGRQLRAALAMDQLDLATGPGAARRAYPGLPCTSLGSYLAATAGTAGILPRA